MGTGIACEIPYFDTSILITGNELHLIRMDNQIIDGTLQQIPTKSLSLIKSSKNSLCAFFARKSQIFMVPSSLPQTTHLLLTWNWTAVTFEVWPSREWIMLGLFPSASYILVFGLPAAAMNRLSGEIVNRLTWLSGCWTVREHIPLNASQNLIVRSYPCF